ncbi:unnamed protein product [Arctia plantaginis]|uniref:CCHC-type domain-containing protein n=1 Tax=Arctia plantaginis TaxID=874455 RepID=A0A8S0ZEK0_ARCPL|nr:unnamed protein product [Arctia plantaginis]
MPLTPRDEDTIEGVKTRAPRAAAASGDGEDASPSRPRSLLNKVRLSTPLRPCHRRLSESIEDGSVYTRSCTKWAGTDRQQDCGYTRSCAKWAIAARQQVCGYIERTRSSAFIRRQRNEVKEVKASFKKGSGVMCYRCCERGHLQLNCPLKNSQMTRLKKVEERLEELIKKRDETLTPAENQGNK